MSQVTGNERGPSGRASTIGSAYAPNGRASIVAMTALSD
jgi:hypothetical protein